MQQWCTVVVLRGTGGGSVRAISKTAVAATLRMAVVLTMVAATSTLVHKSNIVESSDWSFF